MICERCHEEICKHGICYCQDERCYDCTRREQLEYEADREAAWQRNVIGPIFGFSEDE